MLKAHQRKKIIIKEKNTSSSLSRKLFEVGILPEEAETSPDETEILPDEAESLPDEMESWRAYQLRQRAHQMSRELTR